VVFIGPTGVGKGYFARMLHREAGGRGEFVEITGGQLTESLLHSQLFGHEAGSFTGAQQRSKGAFERAAGGVLFLDEMQHWSKPVQCALLHVLGEEKFLPIGSKRELHVECRTLFASTRPLEELVADGLLLPDLRWRLGLLEIAVPPLATRRADILTLADGFLEQARERFRIDRQMAFDSQVVVALLSHDWPGNLRELRCAVEYMAIHADGAGSSCIGADHLPPALSPPVPSLGGCALELRQAAVAWMLGKTGGNRSEAARRLGIHRNTVVRRVAGSRVPAGRIQDGIEAAAADRLVNEGESQGLASDETAVRL
jgi:DNA-binding NtrC family response regulator